MITTGSVKVEGDLTPDETSMIQCKHGNAWSDLDPVAIGWIRCNRPYTYYLQWTDNSKRNVLYCKTSGDCGCELDYDGQLDLLLNLDGKHMVHYGLLYHYLHLMMEGRNPLAAFTGCAKI
jgi:hypothetical protein